MVDGRIHGRRSLLLVEDSDDDAALSVSALRQAVTTADILVARDGEAALELLHGGGPGGLANGRGELFLPAVILLDLKLPKLDGLQVLKRVRADERTRLVPIVVFTSSDDQSDLRRCYQNGASSYVRKPADSETFRRTVQAIGLYWLSVNEVPSRAGG